MGGSMFGLLPRASGLIGTAATNSSSAESVARGRVIDTQIDKEVAAEFAPRLREAGRAGLIDGGTHFVREQIRAQADRRKADPQAREAAWNAAIDDRTHEHVEKRAAESPGAIDGRTLFEERRLQNDPATRARIGEELCSEHEDRPHRRQDGFFTDAFVR
jgi:hypothetical protein